MTRSVMLIGSGDLGAALLELLVREPGIGRIVVASRDAERGVARVNLARLGAIAHGHDPDLRFLTLDLTNREAVAETVHRERPALIVHTATMQSWSLPDLLPPPQAAVIRSAGFGVWLPVHLALSLDLMQALEDAVFAGVVLAAPFPDVVNGVLGKCGRAPTCGVGNVDEIVAKVRWLAAERLGVARATVRVFLVAHHALWRTALAAADGDVPPFLLRVEYDGEDVTDAVRGDELLLNPVPLSAGRATNALTAGSTVRLIRAMLSTRETLLHVPGPGGLPGGYPVWAGARRVRLGLPTDWPEAQAVEVNERSHRFDGIEAIESDGTVVFAAAAADVLRDALGYECRRLPPEEAKHRAVELIARFHEYAARYGVQL